MDTRVNKESVHIIGFFPAWCNPGGHEVLELTENFIVESLQKFTVDDLLGVGPNILENLFVDSFDPGLCSCFWCFLDFGCRDWVTEIVACLQGSDS